MISAPSLIAQGVLVAAAVFVVCLLLLHVTQPDLHPASRMLSEYALGRGGALMTLAFFAMAAVFLLLCIALRAQLHGIWGALGQLALLLAAVGSAMGGLFPMDPVGTPPDRFTSTGKLHGLAFMLGGPGALLSATFVNLALARQPSWQAARLDLQWTGAMVWGVYIAFSVAVVLLMKGNKLAANWAGWFNRALVLSWMIWAVVLVRAVLKSLR